MMREQSEKHRQFLDYMVGILLYDVLRDIFFHCPDDCSFYSVRKGVPISRSRAAWLLAAEYNGIGLSEVREDFLTKKVGAIPGLGILTRDGMDIEFYPAPMPVYNTQSDYGTEIATDNSVKELIAKKIISDSDLFTPSYFKQKETEVRDRGFCEVLNIEGDRLAPLLIDWHREVNRELVSKQPLRIEMFGTFEFRGGKLVFTRADILNLVIGLEIHQTKSP